MSVIIIDDGLVHYEALGRGKPLLLLHGWLGSWRYWVPVMEELSVDYRVYAFDLWGFGDSDRRNNEYDVDSYVKLLDAFIESLGILNQPLPVVGHALGAVIALRWAARNHNRIDRIMAVSLPVVGTAINRRLMTPEALKLFGKAFNQQPSNFEALQLETRKADEDAIINSVRSVMGLDMQRELQQIDLPVLLVHGERDNVVTPFDGIDALNSWEFVRGINLTDSRHFPMLDERTKFNRLLRDFLVAEDVNALNALSLKEEWRRRSR
jgi:pimeloyl-ACP methyl ester carboxylesterase